MQTYIALVVAICASDCLNSSFAQGTINFNNRGLRGPQGFYDAPVSLPDGTLASGPEFTAGLFLVSSEGSLNMVTTSPFRTGAAAGFFQPQNLAVPGTTPGSPATFRVRVWETIAGSYENAITTSRLYGEFPTENPNNDIFVPEMGGMSGLGDIPFLDGIQPFTLVPEPSAIWIFVTAGILVCVGKSSFSRRVSNQ